MKTIHYNGTNYELIKIDNEEIVYTDGKSIFSFNRYTGNAVYNTGNGKQHTYRLASAFNPKSFSPDPHLLDNLVRASYLNDRVGKAYEHTYGTVYVLPSDYNTSGCNDVECLLLERNERPVRTTLYPDQFGKEVEIPEFLKRLRKCVARIISDNSLSEKILREI